MGNITNITEEQINSLKNKGYSFPISMKFRGEDLEPINLFNSLKGKYKFILESRGFGGKKTRYSYMGVNPYRALILREHRVRVVEDLSEEPKEEQYKGNIFEALKEYIGIPYRDLNFSIPFTGHNIGKHSFTPYSDLNCSIPFTGGAVGYMAYDFIEKIENIKNKNPKEIDIPESFLMFYKVILVYDHREKSLSLIYNVNPDEKKELRDIEIYLNELYENLTRNYKEEAKNNYAMDVSICNAQPISSIANFKSNYDKEEYYNLVEKAKEYVKAGDVFQVVLSQRFSTETKSKPFEIYRRLRIKNPSPYMFYIDFNDFNLIGASPESLVSTLKDKIITNPIAGTRKRGKDEIEDRELQESLLKDPKERSEHVMLVDLGRNDVGKISEFGSVKIDRFMEVERYSHVMHMVSEVSGKLKEGVNFIDALKACFPAGTVSGAPKVRAMEIIAELENVKREFYAGSVGYIGFNGNMDMAIAIRTMLYKEGKVYIQAGGGIVKDSNPELEYMETLNKAKAVMEVI